MIVFSRTLLLGGRDERVESLIEAYDKAPDMSVESQAEVNKHFLRLDAPTLIMLPGR
jgi:hypothetical protein